MGPVGAVTQCLIDFISPVGLRGELFQELGVLALGDAKGFPRANPAVGCLPLVEDRDRCLAADVPAC